jgi:hypothetical protein
MKKRILLILLFTPFLYPKHVHSQAMKLSKFGNSNISGQNRNKWGREKIEFKSEGLTDIQSNVQSQNLELSVVRQDQSDQENFHSTKQQIDVFHSEEAMALPNQQETLQNQNGLTEVINTDNPKQNLSGSITVNSKSNHENALIGKISHVKSDTTLSKQASEKIFNQIDTHFVEDIFTETWNSNTGALKLFNYD